MPLFYQHNINESAKLAVWQITEKEDFFLEKIRIKKEIMHPHKRLQHLAGRYLLQILYPDFPFDLIEIAESRKPFLLNEKIHFSISHCGDYAAAIISENSTVGIDVELSRPKIEKVKNKFLNQSELDILSSVVENSTSDYQLLTLFWSSKEAIFKWYGKGAVSFKENIILEELFLKNNKGIIDAHFIKEKKINLKIEFRLFEKLSLAWVSEDLAK
jgi:phosphopantetheinyl transferase